MNCGKQKQTKLGLYDSYCNKEANHKGRHWYMYYGWWIKNNIDLTTTAARSAKVEP